MFYLKAIGFTLGFLCLFFLLSLLSLGLFAYNQVHVFSQTANTTPRKMVQLLQSSWQHQATFTDGHKNMLILGVDSLSTRGEIPPLTDTMILVSLNAQTGQVNLLSLPRDLWSSEYKTKINALYAYGQDRYPEAPETFPTEVISQMTTLPIHHTLVLSLEQVATIIDLVGGVEITIEEGFTDPEFPRPDVDVTQVTDPEQLYQTVSFEAGSEVMNGERALQYIRSRHAPGDQGTDDARAQRQQQVIQALVQKAMQPQLYQDPQRLGQLYAYYQSEFGQVITVPEAVATLKQLWPVRDQISLNKYALSIYPESNEGVLYHPPSNQYNGQWVYAIRDSEAFREEIKEKLQ